MILNFRSLYLNYININDITKKINDLLFVKQDLENKLHHVLLCLQEESSDKVQVEGVNTTLRSQVATLKEQMQLAEQLQNKINRLSKISVRNVNKAAVKKIIVCRQPTGSYLT